MIEKEPQKWEMVFDERQAALIRSCRQYVTDGAPGLPGHQLMLIVAKMTALLDAAGAVFAFEEQPGN